MVGVMGVWDIAAVMLIIVTPLAVIASDLFGSTILAAVQRRRHWWIRPGRNP
jgi:hypothetical protein